MIHKKAPYISLCAFNMGPFMYSGRGQNGASTAINTNGVAKGGTSTAINTNGA